MKKMLRKKILEKFKNLNPLKAKSLSDAIKNRLLTLSCFINSQKIGIYHSKDNEVDTKKIINKYLTLKNIYLPKINKTLLEFRKIASLKDLKVGPFDILEPKNKCPKIKIDELELIIIPCIAIDLTGNRIGRGMGYFDKALAATSSTLKICLAYEFQVLKKIIPEAHDQKLDLIITEKRIISTKKRSPDSKIIDGKTTANNIIAKLKTKIKSEKINATLAVILVGNDPASELYVRKKSEICKEVGINFNLTRFDYSVDQKQLITTIKKLNINPQITGILVQLPLPTHINSLAVINAVSAEKDVDGLTSKNQNKLSKGREKFACCTPKGILRLLAENNIEIKNKKIALVGYGKLVGKPLAFMLKSRGLDFTVYTNKTKNLKNKTKKADVLISATGVAHLIKNDLIKKNAVIIDAGTSKLDGKLVGDVDFENVFNKASRITPVPGGVGPMTIAMLIENIRKAYKAQKKKLFAQNQKSPNPLL